MRRRLVALALLFLPASYARSGDAEVRLLTDDAIPRYLARGQELAKAEQWEKMVDVLHRVIIGDPEVFPDLKPEVLHSAVYSADGLLFYPARELCLKELAKLPPPGLQAYRDAFDLKARTVYDEVKRVGNIGRRLVRYAEVYDNYFVSSVGDDALEAAADLNLMLGRYYEALGLFRRLIDIYPKDTDREMPMVLAKAAFCAARIGDVETRDNLLDFLVANHGGTRIRMESKPIAVEDLREHPRFAARKTGHITADADWPMAGGNGARSRISEDLPESLPRKPLWSFRIAEREARLTAPYGFWMVSLHDREPTSKAVMNDASYAAIRPYPTVRPVVHDGVVMYKDYLEIVARRLGSGRMVHLRGRYSLVEQAQADPEFLYPVRMVRPGTHGNPNEAQRFEMVFRHHDYGGNSLVVDGERIIAVESSRPPHYLITVDAPHSGGPNLLVAYSRATGKTTWAWDADFCAKSVRNDPSAYKAWQQDFQAHSSANFRGPGALASGILYTLVNEKSGKVGSLSLWAIDAADGRVRYRTPIHYSDETRRRIPLGSSLAVAGGVVYVVPQTGVVAAVDALPPGRIRWIRRYDRNYKAGGRAGRRRGGRRRGMIEQGFAYNEPLVAGGRVIVAAADSKGLVALDADTGREVWRQALVDLGDSYHVVGVSDGTLVLAGNSVVGIDLAKGKRLWGPHRLDGFPYGRGLVGARYAYVPVHYAPQRKSAIERYDLRTGVRSPPLEFDVGKLGNITYVDGRLIAATEDEVMCFSTAPGEIQRIDAGLRERGEDPELRFERALVALMAEPQNRDAARADLMLALRAAARPGLWDTEVKIRVAALENLFEIADERMDLGALDEAVELVAPLAKEARGAPDFLAFHPYEAQIALLRARILGRLGRGEESLAALEAFLDTYASGRVKVGNRVVAAPAAAAATRETLIAKNAAFRAAFENSVRERIKAAYEAKDKDALDAIPLRYGKRPPAEESYFALAKLCEEENDFARAALALRRFLREFKDHERAGEAHLRLALLLAKKGLFVEARRARDEGQSRLDEEGRREHAALLAELAKLLPLDGATTLLERLKLPLAAQPLPATVRDAAPVQITGSLPENMRGMTLLASADRYVAIGSDGKILWQQATAAGRNAAAGPSGEFATSSVAAAIAGARFARVIGEDLVLGDVAGLMRVSAADGTLRWRYPENATQAANEAKQALDRLRRYLRETDAPRASPLPGFAISGKVIVRVHLGVGVEAFHVDTGALVWQDTEIKGTPVGPPVILGHLLAVGWSQPGRVRIYEATDGDRPLQEYLVPGPEAQKPGVLLAPPVLDPLGRLIVVTAADSADGQGRLRILNARNLRRAHPQEYQVYDQNAAVLHADGKVIVYHDGSSADNVLQNLHFIDMQDGKSQAARTGVMLRDFWLIRDGHRLFVFTHQPGDAGVGARLFRVDLESADVLEYDYPPQARAYARPVLTQRYLAIVAATPRLASVRLYDREASADTNRPQRVFAVAGGKMSPDFDFQRAGTTRYDIPAAIAAFGPSLVVSTPFGAARLTAKD